MIHLDCNLGGYPIIVYSDFIRNNQIFEVSFSQIPFENWCWKINQGVKTDSWPYQEIFGERPLDVLPMGSPLWIYCVFAKHIFHRGLLNVCAAKCLQKVLQLISWRVAVWFSRLYISKKSPTIHNKRSLFNNLSSQNRFLLQLRGLRW